MFTNMKEVQEILDMISIFSVRFRPDTAKFVFFVLIGVSILYFVVVTRSAFKSDGQAGNPMPAEGLRTKNKNFTLERKPFRILSGSMHYFRIPYRQWQDRITKLKAMGLNTVETYVPWNLHEPEPGKFDFLDALDISSFLHTVQANGLYAILRPGPYVCTEWDLGGLPSWLLRDKNMKLRSTYEPFMAAAERYLKRLSEEVEKLQYSFGGPIIAIQIENEYGTYGSDSQYMKSLKQIFVKHGLKEFPFVCDNSDGLGNYELDGALKTVNFQTGLSLLDKLETVQPDAPLFVTEFWIGWYDHWGKKHHKVKTELVADILKKILQRGGSFSFYMFHGGTNFGFMNGANADRDGKNYASDTTSYDYDAPVSEVGDLTPKYFALRKVIMEYAPKESIPKELPWIKENGGRTVYGDVTMEKYLTLDSLLEFVDNKFSSKRVMPMEEFPINNNAGQSYGYVLYRTTVTKTAGEVTVTDVRDHTTVMLDGEVLLVSRYGGDVIKVPLPASKGNSKRKLDILVENCGRVNYERWLDKQRKGILGSVQLDDNHLENWVIYPLEFKPDFISSVLASKKWKSKLPDSRKVPTLYRGNLYVHHVPRDTLLNVEGWTKGAVFVNKENLGRYWKEGPQKTLYLPESWLRMGDNTVVVFEQHDSAPNMKMSSVAEPEFTDVTYFKI